MALMFLKTAVMHWLSLEVLETSLSVLSIPMLSRHTSGVQERHLGRLLCEGWLSRWLLMGRHLRHVWYIRMERCEEACLGCREPMVGIWSLNSCRCVVLLL